ncbi:tetratricopeptide repeat protein, partial [uncultured Nostoc sp.]|uniref:tetratricopeptide repeat protein n=1 Tax=uncultured Nostoc sp. TaxID=340711 RepID=UPI0035CB4507
MLKNKNLLVAAIICLYLSNGNSAFGKDVGVVFSKIHDAQSAVPQSKNAVANFKQGTNLYKQGDFKGAEAAFRKAIELEPNFAQAYIALANTLDDQGKPQEAIAHYKKA